jgi:hypothetical protein
LNDELIIPQETPTKQPLNVSPLHYANALAGLGYAAGACCWPDDVGQCPFPACPGAFDKKLRRLVPHTGDEIGKAPIIPNGVDGATTNTAVIFNTWRKYPSANVFIALQPSKLVMVDPDSPAALEEIQRHGLPSTLHRVSRNPAFLYQVPPDTPAVRLIHKGASGHLDILSAGYCIVYGRHRTGCLVYLENPAGVPAPAPEWVLDMIQAYSEEQKAREEISQARIAERQATVGSEPPVRLFGEALAWWSGKKWAGHDGVIDRSKTLFCIGLCLARANASEWAITQALAERDVTLGYSKYADRRDGDVRYQEIAQKILDIVVGHRDVLVNPWRGIDDA